MVKVLYFLYNYFVAMMMIIIIHSIYSSIAF
jgi:hypothetical protein